MNGKYDAKHVLAKVSVNVTTVMIMTVKIATVPEKRKRIVIRTLPRISMRLSMPMIAEP
jgi:hypothetical protein